MRGGRAGVGSHMAPDSCPAPQDTRLLQAWIQGLEGRSSLLQAAPPGSLLQRGSQKHLTPTSGIDHDRSVLSHMALALFRSPADVLACPLKLKLTLSTWDVGRGLSRCVGT